jgi:adenylate kinase family enzyme
MLTMQLSLNIDAQKFIQQVQMNNQMLEGEVQKGLDKAFDELSKDGTIEKMIQDAVKKNIMDSFSRWVFQSDIRSKIEKQITEKMSAKIDAYTDSLVNEIAEKMNLPKDE